MGKLYVARSRELVELVVLGLAVERPRHPYEMLRQVRSRGNTSFLRGLPRSLYHAVDALHDATHLQVEDVSSSDGRPERTVYSATASGHAAFRDRLVHLLRTPIDQATFHAAMSLVARGEQGARIASNVGDASVLLRRCGAEAERIRVEAATEPAMSPETDALWMVWESDDATASPSR